MRVRTAAVLVLTALLAAGCGGAARPHFEAAGGWHVLTEPGQIVSAATVPFAAADRLQAGSARWDVGVWVFFGTAHPSRSTVAAANAELARLRF